MKRLKPSQIGLFWALTVMIATTPVLGSPGMEPISKMAPEKDLRPQVKTDCVELLTSLQSIIRADVNAARAIDFKKSELLNLLSK